MGPASDVYSLGAVLYHLLTGRPPFAAAAPRDTIHQVLNQESVSPRLFETNLSKDLETISLKCLQKEPHNRYLRMQELAKDLQRFLENRPILARPISRPARLWRWCRRRPLVATLTLACLLLLVAGKGFSTYNAIAANQNAWEATQNEDRANQNAENERIAKEEANTNLQKARSALRELTQMSFRLKNVPEAQDLRTEMLQIVLAHSNDIVSSSVSNPDLQSDLADAYKNIGFVKGTLGSKKESIESFKSAIEVMENSLKNSPEKLDLKRQLAETLNSLGWTLYESGENDEAVERFRHAITLLTQAEKQVNRKEHRLLLASCYHNLSIVLSLIAGIEEAIDPAQKSWELSKQLVDSAPENYSFRTRHARIDFQLGIFFGRQGRWDEAVPHFDETYKIHQQLLKENPADMDAHRRITLIYTWFTRASIH